MIALCDNCDQNLLETPPLVGEYVLPPDHLEEGGADSDRTVISLSKRERHQENPRSRSESPSSPDPDSLLHRNHSGINTGSLRRG